jgi:hypothetical protein
VTGEPPPTPGPPPPPPETDGEPTNLFIFDKLVEREKARVRRDFRMADDIREVSVPPSASNAIECLRGPLIASNCLRVPRIASECNRVPLVPPRASNFL